jgi:hypothetical protein
MIDKIILGVIEVIVFIFIVPAFESTPEQKRNHFKNITLKESYKNSKPLTLKHLKKTLPEDTLLIVCNYCDLKDLLKLSRTNKHISQLIKRYLVCFQNNERKIKITSKMVESVIKDSLDKGTWFSPQLKSFNQLMLCCAHTLNIDLTKLDLNQINSNFISDNYGKNQLTKHYNAIKKPLKSLSLMWIPVKRILSSISYNLQDTPVILSLNRENLRFIADKYHLPHEYKKEKLESQLLGSLNKSVKIKLYTKSKFFFLDCTNSFFNIHIVYHFDKADNKKLLNFTEIYKFRNTAHFNIVPDSVPYYPEDKAIFKKIVVFQLNDENIENFLKVGYKNFETLIIENSTITLKGLILLFNIHSLERLIIKKSCIKEKDLNALVYPKNLKKLRIGNKIIVNKTSTTTREMCNL